jgi:hypothetical protein
MVAVVSGERGKNYLKRQHLLDLGDAADRRQLLWPVVLPHGETLLSRLTKNRTEGTSAVFAHEPLGK